MSTLQGRPKRLVLIRHAQSARNAAKAGNVHFPDEESREEVKGIPDYEIPITELGQRQAELASPYIIEKYGIPDYIYDSYYRRTRQTKKGLLKSLTTEQISKIEQRSTNYLRERDAGYTYDMTHKEVEKHFPYLEEHFKTVKSLFARPVGGESMIGVAERLFPFLEKVYNDRNGQTVWFICHGGTIKSTRLNIEHISPWDFLKLENSNNVGITVYDQVWVPRMVNGIKEGERKKLILTVANDTGWATDESLIT